METFVYLCPSYMYTDAGRLSPYMRHGVMRYEFSFSLMGGTILAIERIFQHL